MTRRRFLKIALAVGASATTIGIVAWRFPTGTLRERYYRLATDVAPAPLKEQVRRTLMAVVEVLIGAPFEPAHYEDFFSWHAENLPGYRGLYQRMTAMLDRLGAASAQQPFADLSLDKKRGIDGCGVCGNRPHAGPAFTAITCISIGPRSAALYANTDAGSFDAAWPGQPRGLDRYVRTPEEKLAAMTHTGKKHE
jgi:hypothetical protein